MALSGLGCASSIYAQSSPTGLWHDVTVPATTKKMARGDANDQVLPTTYRSVSLDTAQLTRVLRGSPPSGARVARHVPSLKLELPLPDGGFSTFTLTDSGTMPAALARRFPGIMSLKGEDGQGRTVRADVHGDNIQAQITDPAGTWQVQPTSTLEPSATKDSYLIYRRRDAAISTSVFSEGHLSSTLRSDVPASPKTTRPGTSGGAQVLRDFRIAVTATSAYTKAMGGTIPDAMAGVIRTINRVNQVFENDLGVHLTLIADNDKLVLTDPGKDPFSELGDHDTIYLNPSFTNERVGEQAYDIGHVLDAKRSAGLAGLGNTCANADDDAGGREKAMGVTGLERPLGDPFHIDFVAHELGHQFGARHTYNGCRHRANQGMEPGSGSTIMGYAGLCRDLDLQGHSDPYFHSSTIAQVQASLDSAGGRCASTRAHPGYAPLIDPASLKDASFVPARTPLVLAAHAGFADPLAQLTYTWEQIDLGKIQTGLLSDTGSGPLFRSRAPQSSAVQTFPAMSVLLGKEPINQGDTFPLTTRDINFRLVVRDNLDQRSHVVTAEKRIHVIDTGIPFQVIAPVEFRTVRATTPMKVRWRVAKTDKAPIVCKNVAIDLSVDGGETFLDASLAENAPNTGNAEVTLPAGIASTARARIRVSCATQPFFALSPGDFTIRK